MNILMKLIAAACAVSLLGGCAVVKTTGKVAALPFKAVYKTGELTGKGLYYTGKGVYNVAKVPVTITNAALDTSIKVLTVTTQAVDLTGKVVTVSRTMQRGEVDAYVARARGATNVLGLVIDVARGL